MQNVRSKTKNQLDSNNYNLKTRNMEEIKKPGELEKGDKILFKGRSRPLKVEKADEEKALIKGPLGGEYELFDAEDAKHLLVSKPGDRDYASYAENVRKIGEWKKKEDEFTHTDTEASVKLYRNEAGFWNVKIDGLDADFDRPRYGFSNKEKAMEEALKIVEKNPEG